MPATRPLLGYRKYLMITMLLAIAILLVLIARGYSADLLNGFNYEMAKTIGGLDKTLAGR